MDEPKKPSGPPPGRKKEVSPEERARILELQAQGASSREIAQRLSLGRRVVRRILLEEERITRAAKAASKLDPFREAIRERVAKNLTVVRIRREIAALGYLGGETILRQYVRSIRPPKPARKKAWRRFETEPGEELQVDWSTYTVSIGGQLLRVQAFCAVLAWSRKAHVGFYRDQRRPTFLEAAESALRDLRGAARRMVVDSMAAIVLGRAGQDGRPLWQPQFLDFARHYGFEPFLCRPGDPDRKGKGERFFWYLEQGFVRGGAWDSLDHLNAAVRRWLDEVANRRVHKTTGRVPDEAWEEELPYLIALPDAPYPLGLTEARRIGPDAVISVAGTRYSVPVELAHQTVSVRRLAERFEVLDRQGKVVMERRYATPREKGRLLIDPAHYAPIDRGPRDTSRPRPDTAFLERFPDLGPLLDGIRARMKSLSHVHIRALLVLADRYGDEPFLTAAQQAQSLKRFDSHAVRRLLEVAFPLLPEEPIPPVGAAARALAELGDVDSGSLDDYAHLDQDQGADEKENEHGC